METELLPAIRGNVRLLRTIWNSRIEKDQPTSSSHLIHSQQRISDYKSFINAPKPTIITDDDVEDMKVISTTPLQNEQTETSKESIPMIDEPINVKVALHHWHVTRNVVRSGLILHRPRRASDSILPLLKKTHARNSPTSSIDSTFIVTPFESLIDYVSYTDTNNSNDDQSLLIPTRLKRITSDRTDCIRRNRLEESISQYERILRHLKNYEQFMLDYSVSSNSPSSIQQRRKSFDEDLILSINDKKERLSHKISRKSSQTQSLSFRVSRTFTEYVIEDLFSSVSLKSSPIEDEPLLTDDLGMTLHELDTMLEQSLPLTANSPVNVIVINSPELSNIEPTIKSEKPLIERLFAQKKTAFQSDQLEIQSTRLSKNATKIFTTTKQKYFDTSEEPIYVTKMIKINRHHYKKDIRLFCITKKQIYNINRKNSIVKESLQLDDIIGISCTPYKDGFICIHTKQSVNDRGDWLLIVEYPCELITYLFMAMNRENNDDNFLKFQSKISPRRQSVRELDIHEDAIEVHSSSTFQLKTNGKNSLIIFTP